MNLYDGTDLLETTSTEIKNRIIKPGQMLRAIDTGALYYGDKDGKPTAFVGASTSSSGGVEFDAPTTDAIIAIAGDASSGSSTAQIVDGYPVEVTGTTEVLVSAVPCDVIWIAHNGAAGTITVRDAGVTGTGITAVKTIDMAATPTMQPGSLRTQYGVTATLTAGKATLWVRPL